MFLTVATLLTALSFSYVANDSYSDAIIQSYTGNARDTNSLNYRGMYYYFSCDKGIRYFMDDDYDDEPSKEFDNEMFSIDLDIEDITYSRYITCGVQYTRVNTDLLKHDVLIYFNVAHGSTIPSLNYQFYSSILINSGIFATSDYFPLYYNDSEHSVFTISLGDLDTTVTTQKFEFYLFFDFIQEDIYNLIESSLQSDFDYTDAYNNGYSTGFDKGYGEGYDDGFTDGADLGEGSAYQQGYNEGYSAGSSAAHPYTFSKLFGAIADVPILIVRNLLGFEVFGVQAIAIFMTMITGTIAIFIIRKFI